MTCVKSQVCPSLSIFFTNWQLCLFSLNEDSVKTHFSRPSLLFVFLIFSLSPSLSRISSKLRKLVNTAQKNSSEELSYCRRSIPTKKREVAIHEIKENPRFVFFSFSGYKKAFRLEIMKMTK